MFNRNLQSHLFITFRSKFKMRIGKLALKRDHKTIFTISSIANSEELYFSEKRNSILQNLEAVLMFELFNLYA